MTLPLNKLFGKCAPGGDKRHLLALKQVAGNSIVAVSDFLRLIGVPENAT